MSRRNRRAAFLGASTAISGTALWSNLFGAAPAATMLEIDEPVLLDIDATVHGMEIVDGGELIFDPAASRLLRVDSQLPMCVMAGGKLAMKPANATITHEIRFIGVDESLFTAGGGMVHDGNPGLCVEDGELDLVGALKTGWTRTTAALSAGATSCTVVDATGWRIGDEIVITPTQATTVASHWLHFDRRTLTNVVGNVLSFAALTYAHPSNTSPLTAAVIYPEVANLTRNVKISGDFEPGSGNVLGQTRTNGRAQIMIMSDLDVPVPSTIKYVECLHLGPRQLQAGESVRTDIVLGRYALHFHFANEGTRGTVVEGVSVHDVGSRAFVPHGSNGITFTDCVAWSCFNHGYWWDSAGQLEVDESDDILYDHCLAGYVRTDSGPLNNGGFWLAAGVNITARNCVATVTMGGTNAGYHWPENLNQNPHNLWIFEDNDAHNNVTFGIRVWQNDSNFHDIVRSRLYNNDAEGASNGAYRHVYHWTDNEMWGNGNSDMQHHANSGPQRQQTITGGYIGVLEMHGALLDQDQNTLFQDVEIGALVIDSALGGSTSPKHVDFVDCGLSPANVSIIGTMTLTSEFRVQTGASAWSFTTTDGTDLVVTPIALFA